MRPHRPRCSRPRPWPLRLKPTAGAADPMSPLSAHALGCKQPHVTGGRSVDASMFPWEGGLTAAKSVLQRQFSGNSSLIQKVAVTEKWAEQPHPHAKQETLLSPRRSMGPGSPRARRETRAAVSDYIRAPTEGAPGPRLGAAWLAVSSWERDAGSTACGGPCPGPAQTLTWSTHGVRGAWSQPDKVASTSLLPTGLGQVSGLSQCPTDEGQCRYCR